MLRPLDWRSVALCASLLGSTLPACPAAAQDSLYKALGEKAGIERIAGEMLSLVVKDDRVKDDFDNINLDWLKLRLTDKICQLVHGPCVYKGQSMADAHRGLDLNKAKFNAVAEDLQTAMERVGIPYWTQNRLMALLAPMERDIVTK